MHVCLTVHTLNFTHTCPHSPHHFSTYPLPSSTPPLITLLSPTSSPLPYTLHHAHEVHLKPSVLHSTFFFFTHSSTTHAPHPPTHTIFLQCTSPLTTVIPRLPPSLLLQQTPFHLHPHLPPAPSAPSPALRHPQTWKSVSALQEVTWRALIHLNRKSTAFFFGWMLEVVGMNAALFHFFSVMSVTLESPFILFSNCNCTWPAAHWSYERDFPG